MLVGWINEWIDVFSVITCSRAAAGHFQITLWNTCHFSVVPVVIVVSSPEKESMLVESENFKIAGSPMDI